MKLTTWNCNKAYFKKPRFNSDITIIQECAKADGMKWWANGIGVESNIDFTLIDDSHFDCILPLRNKNFDLFGIWAKQGDGKANRYISQTYKALEYHLTDRPTIIAGDFNWNIRWDTKLSGRIDYKWRDLIELFNHYRISSGYHSYFEVDYGQESQSTFYMQRNIDKPYHIDYCFVSPHFKVERVDIGNYHDWIRYSDHMPLTVEVRPARLLY